MRPVALLGNTVAQCVSIILMGWAGETKAWNLKPWKHCNLLHSYVGGINISFSSSGVYVIHQKHG